MTQRIIPYKKLLVLVVLILLTGLLYGCQKKAGESTDENNQQQDTQKEFGPSQEEVTKTLEGKIKVPYTAFRPQQEVKNELESLGLHVKFVRENMKNKADANTRLIKKGECSSVNSATIGVSYFEAEKVGDKYGFYADKGALIILGYADRDYNGIKEDNNSSDTNHTQENNTSDSNKTDDSTNNSSNTDTKNKENNSKTEEKKPVNKKFAAIDKKLGEYTVKFDTLTKKATEYKKKPTTYTATAAATFEKEYTILLDDLEKTAQEIDKADVEKAFTDSASLNVYLATLDKQAIFLAATSELPEIQ